jgi:predicted component of type VI protein secretion system
VTASRDLNLFDGQPHAVTLYLYPLVNPLGFQQLSVGDLLEGETPPGTEGRPVSVTFTPGETRSLEQPLPATAEHLGVVADFYRARGDPEGIRKLVVPARCGFRTPRVTLTSDQLLAN